MHDDMEERAVVIGVAQTLGQAFIAWVPGKTLCSPLSGAPTHLGQKLTEMASCNIERRQVRSRLQDGFQHYVWCLCSTVFVHLLGQVC